MDIGGMRRRFSGRLFAISCTAKYKRETRQAAGRFGLRRFRTWVRTSVGVRMAAIPLASDRADGRQRRGTFYSWEPR
jgi:hypothetical protein